MNYFEAYREVAKTHPAGLRGILRGLALDGLSVLDKMLGHERDLERPRVQFIYVHHVFKDEEPKLDILLKELSRHHTFIPYSEGVDRLLTGRVDKPYVCLSSDDGFKNNLAFARIMERYGAKACFFLNPPMIGNTNYAEIEAFCRERLHFPPVEFLTWDEVAELQKQGHEIGSHTQWHINVAETAPEDFRADCGSALEILGKHCGPVKHFAFPYGRFSHFTGEAHRTVFEAGFTSCASAERGCHVTGEQPIDPRELLIRRDHVIAYWPLAHILYFLMKGSRTARFQGNFHHWEAKG